VVYFVVDAFCFSVLSQEIGWKNVSKNCVVGHKTLTQSINIRIIALYTSHFYDLMLL